MTGYTREKLCQFLDDWLAFRSSQRLIPGFSVAVSANEEIIYRGAFGFADIPAQRFLNTEDIFCIGSQSKMLTGILAMQLTEENRLHLHDRAADYLPWLKQHDDERFRYITIQQLLWHGSGLVRDGSNADFWQLMSPFPDEESLRRLVLNSTLVADSGRDTKYSNVGYALLGQIIEAASGESYQQCATTRIIAPLQLKNTFVDYDEAHDHCIATGHTRHIGGQRTVVSRALPVHAYASVTGWYSTPADMATIMIALYGDGERLIAQANRDILFYGLHAHWRKSTVSRSDYGLGFIQQEFDGEHLVGHSGGFAAHRTCSYFMPSRHVGVSLMTNSNDAPLNEIMAGILGVIAYFSLHLGATADPRLEKFDAILENFLGAKRITVLGDSITSVPLDDWSPFESVEYLSITGQNTLKTIRSHFLDTSDESIIYSFRQGKITSVNYAGQTTWPRHVFLENYKP
ncbi:MAG: serine hydrolase domain-containing protein [Patescibacteria group bacterium]